MRMVFFISFQRKLMLRLIYTHQLLGTDSYHFFNCFLEWSGMPISGSFLMASAANLLCPDIPVHLIAPRAQTHLYAITQCLNYYTGLNAAYTHWMDYKAFGIVISSHGFFEHFFNNVHNGYLIVLKKLNRPHSHTQQMQFI